MVQTVELLLGPATDAAVRAQWQRLADAGLPSQARHAGASNRPHVTLAVATRMPDELDLALAGAAAVLPLPLRLGGLVCFGGRRRVLARLVVPDGGLLDLHAAVSEVVDDCPDRPELTLPGRWTPHVTLARGLTGEQLGTAVALLAERVEPAGAAVGLRRWDGEQRVDRLVAGTAP